VRNIKEYNAKFVKRRLNPENGHRFLPYIVLVIDEFADLIMTAGKEVETPIARLAQLARAVGIHLIIATQRLRSTSSPAPSRPTSRHVSPSGWPKVDSRTILDSGGADQLIGRGDMLLSPAATSFACSAPLWTPPKWTRSPTSSDRSAPTPKPTTCPKSPTEQDEQHHRI
jgi:DNA segregation ATPase FtsK/SpoIIIE, S-DNA-T family